MKELKFSGAAVKGKLEAKVVGSGEISILMINTEGMLFETTSKLHINAHYRFQLTFEKEKIALPAKATQVLLKGMVEKHSRKVTLYHVSVDFENLKDKDKTFLENMIDILIEDDVPVIEDKINGAKFHIED